MARPVRCRRICFEPKYDSFAPCGAKGREQVLLTVDEFEAVRLIDNEKKTHEQCARQMGILRNESADLDFFTVKINYSPLLTMYKFILNEMGTGKIYSL